MRIPHRLWSVLLSATLAAGFLASLSGCVTVEVTAEGCGCCGGATGNPDTTTPDLGPPEDTTTISWKEGEAGFYPTVRIQAKNLKPVASTAGEDLLHKWAAFGYVSDTDEDCASSWAPDPTYFLEGKALTDPVKEQWYLDVELKVLALAAGEWLSLDMVLMPNIGPGGSSDMRLYHFCDQAPTGSAAIPH